MTDTMTDSPPSTSAPESLTFSYVKRPGLFKIALINFFLGIVTLSIWHFWGKTNIRRHVWSCIHINGEPLEYTGTGGELFRGFLMVFAMFILPYLILVVVLNFYLGPHHPALAGLQFLFGLMIWLLAGFALYKQRNFQLTRTNWRGIRGNMAGSAFTYSLTYFGSLLARGASLGWATPVMNTVLQEQMIGEMRFGDAAFKFKGRAGVLYPTYALCWLLALFTVIAVGAFAAFEASQWFGSEIGGAFDRVFKPNHTGNPSSLDQFNVAVVIGSVIAAYLLLGLLISMLWSIYSAKEMRTFALFTRFDGAQFKLKATAFSIVRLVIGNLLLLIFTLGLARPFVVQRNIRYVFNRLSLDGAVDLNRIQQSVALQPKRGEGLADAFDLGAW